MENFGYFFMLVIGFAGGFGIAWWLKSKKGQKLISQMKTEYDEAIGKAKEEKEKAEKQYKELVSKIKEKL